MKGWKGVWIKGWKVLKSLGREGVGWMKWAVDDDEVELSKEQSCRWITSAPPCLTLDEKLTNLTIHTTDVFDQLWSNVNSCVIAEMISFLISR